MYGTVARWVQQIQEWNPVLSEAQCWTVLRAWLGIRLPEVECLADMELGFPQAFFDEVVQEETRRAIAAVGEPAKDPALGRYRTHAPRRRPHDLRRSLSHPPSLRRGRATALPLPQSRSPDAAEWAVISRMCGTAWDEDPDGYWPPADA